MLSSEIQSILKYIPHFKGVFPRDILPDYKSIYPQSIVCNTDTSDKIGTHWIAIYINEDGVGWYFDSFGLPIFHHEFRDYLMNNCVNGFNYNRVSLQCTTCVTCGEYCVSYLLLRSAGVTHSEFLKLFKNNKHTNDYIIKSLFDSIRDNKWISKYVKN